MYIYIRVVIEIKKHRRRQDFNSDVLHQSYQNHRFTTNLKKIKLLNANMIDNLRCGFFLSFASRQIEKQICANTVFVIALVQSYRNFNSGPKCIISGSFQSLSIAIARILNNGVTGLTLTC